MAVLRIMIQNETLQAHRQRHKTRMMPYSTHLPTATPKHLSDPDSLAPLVGKGDIELHWH